MGYSRNLEKVADSMSPMPFVHNIGNLSGTSSLDYLSGQIQIVNITGSLYLSNPKNGVENCSIELWAKSSGSNYTINLTSSILRPSNSLTTWPITLTNGLTTHFKFHYRNNKWVLSSMIGEYSI